MGRLGDRRVGKRSLWDTKPHRLGSHRNLAIENDLGNELQIRNVASVGIGKILDKAQRKRQSRDIGWLVARGVRYEAFGRNSL
jgi:hypothetical protein